MRTILAFATLFLVATAYGAQDNTLDQLTSMAQSKFGRTVLETIQVQLQTKDDPRPEIVRLLDELNKDTATQKSTEEKDFAAYEKNAEAEQKRLREQIAHDEGVVKASEARLVDAKKELHAAESKIAATEKLIAAFKEVLAQKTAIRNRQHANWEIIDARYAKLISILKEVERLLRNRVSARKGSFIEKKADTEFSNALAELKESIAQESEDVDGQNQIVSFLASKAQEMMNLTPEEASAEAGSGLQTVINICVKYQIKYENDREEDAHIELERKLNFTAFRDSQLQRIAVQEDILATTKRQAADLEAEITDLNTRVSEANARISSNTASLKANIAALKQRTEDNKTLIAQLNNELDLISTILNIVNTRLHNLRKNVEQAIIHSSIKA